MIDATVLTDAKVLVDSHIFIWMLYEQEKLSKQARELIESASNVYVSMVSLWELTLKHMHGKLAYGPEELTTGVAALNIEQLPLRNEHLVLLPTIELAHKDPIDALLLAQSEAEGCVMLTADKLLLESKYHTTF